MTLTARPDRRLIRAAGDSRRYVLLGIEAPLAANAEERLPLNTALIIDRSGSMTGEKIAAAREAAEYVIGQLRPTDRFSVVAYDDAIDTLVPSTAATAAAVASAGARVAALEARGTTDLCGGWLRGCQQIAEHLDGEAVSRAFLLTDGLANRGITDPGQICAHAAELRARGVSTSTFGIGADFDEVLLSAMAEAGGGNFHFIAEPAQIPGVFRQELGEGLEVVAPQAQVQISAPPGVRVTSLNGYPARETEAGRWGVALGDLGSGQLLEPVIELRFPRGRQGEDATVVFRLGDAGEALSPEPATVVFEYAGHAANDAQARDREVDRRVATLFAGAARREALALNRDGALDAARRRLARCRQRIEGYAGEDAELQRIAHGLRESEQDYAVSLDAMDRKMAYFDSTSVMKDRSSRGASRKRSARQSVGVMPCSPATEAAANAAVAALNAKAAGLLGRLEVAEIRPLLPAEEQGGTLSALDELQLVDAVAGRLRGHGVRLTTTQAQLEDNWFSHWHASGRTAVVSVFGFAGLVAVPMAAYLAYETVLNGLNNASARYDLLALAHEDTRGCLFDFCLDKRAMEIKLQTMDVCEACRDGLAGMAIDVPGVLRLTDAVRGLAAPVSQPA